MRRCGSLLAIATAGLLAAAPAAPAATVRVAGQTLLRVSVSPDKNAIPAVGAFDCDGAEAAAAVLWFRRGQGRLWTDLGVRGGKLTATRTRLRVPRASTPLVGDYDADGCADILWNGKRRDALWWGGASGFAHQSVGLGGGRAAAVAVAGAPDGIVWRDGGGKARLWMGSKERGEPFASRSLGRAPAARPFALSSWVDGFVQVLWDFSGRRRDQLWTVDAEDGMNLGRRPTRLLPGRWRGSACGPRLVLLRAGHARVATVARTGPVRVARLPHTTARHVAAGLDGAGGCVVAWSGPGSAPDEVWLPVAGSGPGDPEPPTGQPGSGSGAPVLPEARPRLYLNAAHRERLRGLLAAGDEAATRFAEMVDRVVGGTAVYAYEAWYSALIGQLTGEPRYCTDAVARVEEWVTDEEARIGRGERASVAGDSYLEIGPYIGDLSLVFDWCYDRLGAAQRQRWIDYANQAVWNVWHHEQATWGGRSFPWSGWSVDNPSNNYYYSFLRATLFLGLATHGENPQADGWIQKFRAEKIGQQLVPTFTRDLTGGGSREGTGYGVAMKGLFWLYEVWEASTGERLADLTPHTRASLAYLMHLTVPTLDRLAPIGDHARDSTAALFDYHREYAAALAWLYRQDDLARPVRTWLASNSVPRMEQSFEYVWDFLYRDPGGATAPLSALRTTYFAAGVGDLLSRSAWTADATWLALRMGPYTESHAHRDQLSVLLYDDQWLAYDANVESHSGIVQDEAAHNLVRIEKAGVEQRQREGQASTVLALADNATFTYAAADATAVYANQGVVQAQREVVFLKPGVVAIYDRVDTGPGGAFTWQLVSPLQPALTPGGATFGGAGDLRLFSVAPASATPAVVALTATGGDFGAGYRYELRHAADGPARFLTVLSVDGAGTAVSAAPAAGRDGATITLAGGGSATVRFNQDAPGGTLTTDGFDGPLPTGVAAIPVFG